MGAPAVAVAAASESRESALGGAVSGYLGRDSDGISEPDVELAGAAKAGVLKLPQQPRWPPVTVTVTAVTQGTWSRIAPARYAGSHSLPKK